MISTSNRILVIHLVMSRQKAAVPSLTVEGKEEN